MTFYRYLMLALFASCSALASSNDAGDCGSASESRAESEDRGCVLRGSYAYELSGRYGAPVVIGDPLFLNSYGEIGVISFDGRGTATANGVAVVNGVLRQNASYSCTYVFPDPGFSVNPKLGLLTCSRFVGTTPSGTFLYSISYGDSANNVKIIALPSPNTIFSVVQVQGEAQK